ncbi:MAG: hypothetical protein ABIS69_04500 [Sediminibacterium sp.]
MTGTPPSHHHRTTIAPLSYHYRTTIAPPSLYCYIQLPYRYHTVTIQAVVKKNAFNLPTLDSHY